MEHVMLDLETLGTRPYSAIVSLGAVMFDPVEKKLGDEFYRVIELRSCGNLHMTMDSDTVKWWMHQSEEARAVFKGAGIPIAFVLEDFVAFLNPVRGNVKVWGNGANFDNMLLRCAYERAHLAAPWSHMNDRCYRTMKNFHRDVPLVRQGVYHNALDDAKTQAVHLMEMPCWSTPVRQGSVTFLESQ